MVSPAAERVVDEAASFLEGSEARSFLSNGEEETQNATSSDTRWAGSKLLLAVAGVAGVASGCCLVAGALKAGTDREVGLTKVAGQATIEAYTAGALEPVVAETPLPAAAAAAPGPLGVSTPAKSTGEKKTKWAVWISDIHIDPLYGIPGEPSGSACVAYSGKKIFYENQTANGPYGIIGCDPPPSLWQSSVEAARRVSEDFDPDALLFTGDFVRHVPKYFDNPISEVASLIGLSTEEISEKFDVISRGSRVLGTLGNDDNPLNYQLNVTNTSKNPWFARLADNMKEAESMSNRRAETYEFGGYFETKLHNIMVLNVQTVVYSKWFAGENPGLDDPFGQLKWIKDKLTYASENGHKVWIIGHIPPGIETFGFTELWNAKYLDAFLNIVQDPVLGKVIAAQFYGHTHSDEFRLLPNAPAGAGAVLINSALSPIYSNNPNFRLIEYDVETGLIQNMKIWWANITAADATTPLEWKFGYDWKESYPDYPDAAGLTNDGLKAWSKQLEKSALEGGPEWHMFSEWYKALHPNPLMNTRKSDPDITDDEKAGMLKEYFCGIEIQHQLQFDYCQGETKPEPTPPPPASSDDDDLMDFYEKAEEENLARFPKIHRALRLARERVAAAAAAKAVPKQTASKSN